MLNTYIYNKSKKQHTYSLNLNEDIINNCAAYVILRDRTWLHNTIYFNLCLPSIYKNYSHEKRKKNIGNNLYPYKYHPFKPCSHQIKTITTRVNLKPLNQHKNNQNITYTNHNTFIFRTAFP